MNQYSFYDPIAIFLGEWSSALGGFSVLFRLALSVIFAAVIGCERASKRHSAGLRTFILVSLTSAAAMLLDIFLMKAELSEAPLLSLATIISASSISGNSVLFSSRSQIKGLTTSAALWSCAIIGLASGAGLYTVALVSFVFVLCILAYLPAAEIFLKNHSNHFEIHLELKNRSNLQDFVSTIRELGLRIDDIEQNGAYLGSGLSVYSVTVTIASSELKKYKTHQEIIAALKTLDYIYYIEEMR